MALNRPYKILVVDDEEGVCRLLVDLFKPAGYNVETAHSGSEALRKIENSIPDLVISDIQMPGFDGFELFSVLDSKYPEIKHILMTSYDIDQYISLIRQYNIGNIIVKGPEFSLGELKAYVQSLLNGDIFGLQRYFPNQFLHTYKIKKYSETKEICSSICKAYTSKKSTYLEMAIDELISNAVFHGVLQLTDVSREFWDDNIEISPEYAIKVMWAYDEQKIGISVEDPKGRLKKPDVLRWLDATYRDDSGEGEHGRGFLLVRRLIDRLIINIDPGRRTECIIIQYFNSNSSSNKKPLLIHEL